MEYPPFPFHLSPFTSHLGFFNNKTAHFQLPFVDLQPFLHLLSPINNEGT
jgi:hypothetical protein